MVQPGAQPTTVHNQSKIKDESGTMTKELMVAVQRIILMFFRAKRGKQM
jgi:hypothetical protein